MTDAIVGARYNDRTLGREFEIVGIYERAIRGEHGEIKDTEVVVDIQYDGQDDPVRVVLDMFKSDETIELMETPEWF